MPTGKLMFKFSNHLLLMIVAFISLVDNSNAFSSPCILGNFNVPPNDVNYLVFFMLNYCYSMLNLLLVWKICLFSGILIWLIILLYLT